METRVGVVGVPVKKAWPYWFQIRERQGTGSYGLLKRKKAGRLQVQPLSLDTWVPMSPALSIPMSMQVSMPVLACSCLPGEIQGKGYGVALFQFVKRKPQNINAWGYVGVSWCLVGKTERWGQPHRAWTDDYPCLWTGQYPCPYPCLR